MARRIRWQIVIASISALLVVFLLSVLALSNTTVARPMAGGTYTEAVNGTPQQIVPLLNDPMQDPVGRDLGALLFDGLTRLGVDGLPEPALAERWEVDDSGEIYLFHLRQDVTWHDGTPFTADDVMFTLLTIQGGEFTGSPAIATLWRNVLVDKIDDYTIQCTLNAPYAPFLDATSVPILPRHLLGSIPMEAWGESPFARQPVGTGPYQLTELTENNATLSANEDYFGGSPFIEQFTLQFFESPQAALSSLTHQEVEAFGIKASPEWARVTLPHPVRRISLPLDSYVELVFNMRKPPFNEQAMRQALAHALNKDVLIDEVLTGTAVSLDTPILPGWWAQDSPVPWYEHDPDKATQMFEGLGYQRNAQGNLLSPTGQPLVLPLITDSDPARLAVAEEVARQWGEQGIAVEVESLDSMALRRRLREHEFVLALQGWARLGPDPDVFELWHSSQAASGLNYAGLRDDTIDEALINGRTALELVQRSEHYATFQQRWIELVPGIPLYQPLYLFHASEELGGLPFETGISGDNDLLVGHEDRYRRVSRWFVRSSREIQGTLR